MEKKPARGQRVAFAGGTRDAPDASEHTGFMQNTLADMECHDCASFVLCPWLRTEPERIGNKPGRSGSDPVEHDAVAIHMTEVSPGPVTKDADTNQKKLGKKGPEVVLYKRRWLMLALFSLFSMSNAYMWIHLNIIANVILRFYNESLPEDSLKQETAVDWLSLVYMLVYLVFIPFVSFGAGMYILNSHGLRINNLLGCAINAIGAWLKCSAVHPASFHLLMLAQTLCGLAQVFIVSIPPRLAAVWFGHNEVSTATGIGVFGNQVGVALGFLIPPIIVPNSDSLDEIAENLNGMFYGGATICTIILLLMMCLFQSKPQHAPSKAQLLRRKTPVSANYYKSILRLMQSPSFVLLTISYGLITGCYYAFSTLLNFIVLTYFPGEEVMAGYIGLVIIITGIFGAVLAGFWLDHTKYFKATSVSIYLLCAMGMLTLTFILTLKDIGIVFVTSGVLGFFMTGYLPVGYEFAAEITYPEPEGISSGLLTTSAMVFGIVMTIGMRTMMNQISVQAANIFVTVVLFIGTIMTALIKAQYKRQEAEKKPQKRVLQQGKNPKQRNKSRTQRNKSQPRRSKSPQQQTENL
ncbi:feline leukemia virus subgroup C receptor-related protein 2-like isoform X2 [Pomacea canaliculata]|uniref:feline leukemia virus subgroup C receptor-related protein 2-like isoform X2 n=1 Tax=Pomacea canaliculata TaxID=400727 RepID=UPI000D736CB0|nr:feline leukemia virus subgroup C receptor-related protein 2-like isoform X2 [Pomacea canaliculata]